MACLIKPPLGPALGCVSFTTPERDFFIRKDPTALAAVEALKGRYIVGLHHNWHDFDFVHDPLFDFSMAGDADLVERSGRRFPRTPIDCCNFVPAPFFLPRQPEPFWDVINVTREAYFKGHAEFLEAIRAIYDRGRQLRVLHLCPVPRAKPGEDPIPEIRRRHEAMFSMEERRSFTLMTMDWDHPRPLDLETLSFFYRSARVFVHTAPDERRCRIAAYAWASRMPVVARDNVASILPAELQKPPFYFGYDQDEKLPDAILAAVDSDTASGDWRPVLENFRPANAATRLSDFLKVLAKERGRTISPEPVNSSHMDFRLGRHHMPDVLSPNTLTQTVADFCAQLLARSDEELAAIARLDYPEEALLGAQIEAEKPAARTGLLKKEAARRPLKQPSLLSRLRTWARKGHAVPFTRYRVLLDVMRDPGP
jgi:hypothetical protein